MAKPRRESEVLKAVRDYLRLRGAVVTRTNSGVLMLGTKANRRVMRTGESGWADLTGVYRGHAIAVEVKRPLGPRGGTNGSLQTGEQAAFQLSWSIAGGRYCLARCVDDVMDFLDALDKEPA